MWETEGCKYFWMGFPFKVVFHGLFTSLDVKLKKIKRIWETFQRLYLFKLYDLDMNMRYKLTEECVGYQSAVRGLCFVTLPSWKERCFSVLVQVHVPRLLTNYHKCPQLSQYKNKKKKRRDAAELGAFHIASQGQTVPWNRWSKCFIVKDSTQTVPRVTWGSVEAAQRKQRDRTLCFQLGANWRLWQLDKIMKFSVFYLIDFMSQV